jgi:hypothetical protein
MRCAAFKLRLSLVVLGIGLCRIVVAQGTVREDFEGLAASWKAAGADTRYQLVAHDRVREQPHRGEYCERVTLSAGTGSFIHLRHDVAPARVIEELRPSVWVKSDRPGAQILVRVVLPRTKDPRTREPVTFLLRGSGYTLVGQWQQLSIDDLAKQFQRELRVVRAGPAERIDAAEAMVDAVLLNVYTGRGVSNIWIDSLEVSGVIGPTSASTQSSASIRPGPIGDDTAAGAADETAPARRVSLQNSVLLVDGRPFFPRLIEHRGESLVKLRELGFNGVWCEQPPARELLDEAKSSGMWLVAPPPIELTGAIGAEYGPVLAWNLGSRLSRRETEAATLRAEALRQADRQIGRPIVCQAESDIRAYSRVCDVLVLRRDVLGTSLELADYVKWLRERPQLGRADATVWTILETQPAPDVANQWSACSEGRLRSFSFSPERIRELTYAAMGCGVRGICFAAQSRIDRDEPATRRRAATLQLLNLEISLIEPWLAEGQPLGITPERDGQVAAMGLQGRRGQLLIPLRIGPQSQYVAAIEPRLSAPLLVPGVADDDRAYAISPVVVRAIGHRRVAGGTSITASELDDGGFLLVSQNPLLVSHLNRQAAVMRRKALGLEIELARAALAEAAQVSAELMATPSARPGADPRLVEARANLQQAERFASLAELAGSQRMLHRMHQGVSLYQRSAWEAATRGLSSPVASPCAVSFGTLPDHVRLMARLRPGASNSASLLTGGDCEELSALQAAGWKNVRHDQEGIGSHVELSPVDPAAGKSCLHLAAFVSDEKQRPTQVDTPPVWVTTGPVNVTAGTVVAISAQVRVPAPIAASVDGLMVIDSVGGPALAMRVTPKPGWQRVELFRVAIVDGPMNVTFALAGLGEAWIDEVAVRPVAVMSPPKPPAVRLRAEEVAPAGRGEPVFAPPPIRP